MASSDDKKTVFNMSVKELYALGLIALVFIVIYFIYPFRAEEVYTVSLSYLQEMAIIIPAVMILMGLFEVWVPKDFIKKHLGAGSGLKGMLLSFLFGTLPTGPLYIAFPIAAGLLKKGARVMNITIFLGTWAASKIPQLMVEIKFLGLEFTAARFVLTVLSIAIIGFLVEYIMKYDSQIN